MDIEVLKEYIPQIVETTVALVLLPLLKMVMRKLVKKYGKLMRKPKARMRRVRYVMAAVFNVLFVIVVIIIWGVQPQNLLTWLAGVAAFLGVAMFSRRSILSNITAGIIMFFSAPYHVGNTVKIIDKDTPIEATIEIIGTFYTHIRTADDELIVIPNNLFLQKMVGIIKK